MSNKQDSTEASSSKKNHEWEVVNFRINLGLL